MKYKSVRHVLNALAGAGLCTAMVGPSQARSLPAILGQPQNPADYNCFVNGGGAVRNRCPETKQFCVGLPVDTSYHQVEVTVRALQDSTRTQNIDCGAQALSREGVDAGFSTHLLATAFNSPQTLYLSGVWVPAVGSLYMCCNMQQDAQLISINY